MLMIGVLSVPYAAWLPSENAVMTTDTPSTGRNDPLYPRARQSVLFHRDASIAKLQRSLRINHERAMALREAMRGDILEYHAQGETWRIAEEAYTEPDLLLPDKLAQVADWIRSAQSMIVAAGAGIGIDSGLPDYRGDGGFWRSYPALGRQGLRFESIASPRAFDERPATAWGFYGHRLNLYRATTPHFGFSVLRSWAQRMPRGCFVFTSNVDGQFQKADFPSARIYECHGTIHRLQCTANCSGQLWPTANLHLQVDEEECLLQSELPCCPRCGALARPNILMFDDWHWNDVRSAQQRTLLDSWLDTAPAPLVLEIGAGRTLATVRHFTLRMQRRGSKLVRINPHDVNIHNPEDIEIALGAKEALERIQTCL